MYLSLAITVCLGLVSFSHQATDAVPSLSDLLAKQANLSDFSDLLKTSLPDVLSQLKEHEKAGQPVTILAPSNAAFDKIPYYSVIGPVWAAQDVDAQRDIIKYHILPGDITTKVLLPTFQFYPTWLTNTTFANVTDGQRVGAVMQGGKLLFFVSGESNRSPSTVRDLKFAGGTVHILDSLLIPPESFAVTASKFSLTAEATRITSFLGAAYENKKASLISLIDSSKDITIFVPNNAAMETVSGALTSMSDVDLDKVLSYHIVVNDKNSHGGGGPYYSTLLGNATTLKTLQGNSLSVSFASNSLFVNSARVLTTDLLISGGVVHVLDNVLDPDITTVSPNPSHATQAPVLPTAGSKVNVSSDAPFTSFAPDLTALTAGATAAASDDTGAAATSGVASESAEETSTPTAAVKGLAATSRRYCFHTDALLFLGLVVAGMVCFG